MIARIKLSHNLWPFTERETIALGYWGALWFGVLIGMLGEAWAGGAR